MSISTTTRKAGPFAGNDAQTVFPFTCRVFEDADLLVVRADADAVETELALGVDYSVTLNADQDSAPGGDVTLSAPLATGYTLAITTQVEALQSVTVTNAGGFFPAVFNGVFDKLTILVQQLTERLGRTMSIPLTASGVTSLQVPVRASAVLQWSADGTRLETVTLPDLSLSLALPNMAGHSGEFLTNDGNTAASWAAVRQVPNPASNPGGYLKAAGDGASFAFDTLTVSDLGDYAADQAAKRKSARAFALSAATLL